MFFVSSAVAGGGVDGALGAWSCDAPAAVAAQVGTMRLARARIAAMCCRLGVMVRRVLVKSW